MALDVKGEILATIGKTDDHAIKSVLLLMLAVLEDIGGRIDNMMGAEVRKAVLNGHEVNHHAHHDWIETQMQAERDAESTAKANKRVAVEQGIRQLVTIIISIAVGVIGGLWAMAK